MLEKLKQWLAWRVLPPSSRRGFEQLLAQIAFYQEDVSRFQAETGDTSPQSLTRYWEQRAERETAPVRESVSDELEEPGWQRLAPTYYAGVSELPYVRQDAVRASRYYSLHDPLLHRAVWLVIRYVWGRGIVGPRSKDPEVQAVIDAMTGDKDNDLLFRITGQWELSQVLIEDGEIFLTVFVNTLTGGVKFSCVLTDEIEQVITHPQNRRKPIYYQRTWSPQVWNWQAHAYSAPGVRQDYWPDWGCPEAQPADLPTVHECARCGQAVTGAAVCAGCGADLRESDNLRFVSYTGTEHSTVGDAITRQYMHQYKTNTRGLRGMPAFYSAFAYVKARKGYMQDRIVLLIALATFAWKQNVKGSTSQVQRMLSQWGSTIFGRYQDTPTRRADQERAPGGRVLLQNESAQLEQMAVDTGSSNAINDDYMIQMGISSGVDITLPNLNGNPMIGNLATAQAMDGPQQKGFEWWQKNFESIVKDSVEFGINQAVKYGALSAVTPSGEPRDLGFELDFPPIVEKDLPGFISAIAQLISAESAAGTAYIAPERIARYILQAFGEQDIATALAELTLDKVPAVGPLPAQGFPDSAADKIEALRLRIEEALGD